MAQPSYSQKTQGSLSSSPLPEWDASLRSALGEPPPEKWPGGFRREARSVPRGLSEPSRFHHLFLPLSYQCFNASKGLEIPLELLLRCTVKSRLGYGNN